ncbi:hypothetical protein U27_03625 [Candidatus Vecturithrix granuli]|uniref:Putative regulatory protein FmdB zinc ribbon domain-containing protein n=1 Tax=Vecturithrix granuli TaxID=1499967 RepID=A0A081BWF7_VECG1|nr:hypothetical protein U27_03625 [Candidatus Vecturithrix granuli]
MPTYEYVCTQCQTKFDVYATLAEKEQGLRPECPKCQSQETRQVFASFAMIGGSKGGTDFTMMPGCGPAAGPGCC